MQTGTGFRNLAQSRGLRQFVKFGFVGASGFAVNFVVAHLLERGLPGLPWAWVFALGFMAGGISNWYLNRIWTFRSSAHPAREALQFLTVSAIALVVGELIIWWRPFGHHFTLTWFIATVAGIFVNFFLNKYWTFRHVA